MQENKSLAIKSTESKSLTTRLPEHSRKMAKEMLTLMSAKFGKELTDPEANSWKEILVGQPPAAIEWAFKEYIRTPPSQGDRKWFPEEWEILDLLRKWHVTQKQLAAKAEQDRQTAELEEARKRGECVSLHDVMAKFNQIAESKKFPQVSVERKNELKSKLLSSRKAGGSAKPEPSVDEKLNPQAGRGETQQSSESPKA
jgi:hypothetical protein